MWVRHIKGVTSLRDPDFVPDLASPIPEIMGVTWPRGQFIFWWLILAVIHLHTECEVSSFINSRDWWGPKLEKGPRDPDYAPLGAVFQSLSWLIYLPYLKCLLSPRDRREVPDLKSTSRDPDHFPFWSNLSFVFQYFPWSTLKYLALSIPDIPKSRGTDHRLRVTLGGWENLWDRFPVDV